MYLGFRKGGKMVATAGGVTLALAPLAALCCLAVWIVCFAVLRYASVASIVTAVALPLFCLLFGAPPPVVGFATLAAIAVIALHHQNIRRLLAGKEPRFTPRQPEGDDLIRSRRRALLVALLPAAVAALALAARPSRRSPRHGAAPRVPTTARRPSPGPRSASSTSSRPTAPTAVPTVVPQISADVDEIEAWWQGQDPTRSPRFDRAAFSCGPQADVELLRMQQTAAQLSVTETTWETIADAVTGLDGVVPHYKYLVYYDGPLDTDRICGQGGGVYDGPGVAVVYVATCAGEPSAATAAHELLHSMGAVPSPGPQHSCGSEDSAHACDSNLDIMWPFATLVPFSSLVLDVNRDDYYAHAGTWIDIQDTRFLRHLDAQGSLALALSGTGSVLSDIPGVSCAALVRDPMGHGHDRHAHGDAVRRAALRALGPWLCRRRPGARVHRVDRTGDAGQCAVRPADLRAEGRRERQGDGARWRGTRLVPLALRRGTALL